MSHALRSHEAAPGPAEWLLPAFACSCTDSGLEAEWVHVAGELDIATTPQLKQTLRETQLRARLVVLDLRDVTFMDTSGVHVIVNASIRARRLGRRLVLLRGPPAVDRVLRMTGSSDAVEVGDFTLDPVEPRVQALQRSLASWSRLKSGWKANDRDRSRR